MWQSLRLRSLGVISEAEVEFGPGFTVITGETGAGKTMVVTALALLRGERANSAMIRRGSDQARIEATVQLHEPDLAHLVIEAGGEADGELVLARVLSPNGRSRAVAGGATVPANLLAKLTDRLVAVHGQSDQQRLVNVDQQRFALDRFAGRELQKLLETFRVSWSDLRTAQKQLDLLKNNSTERIQRLDFLRFGLEEISHVAPTRGEDHELKAEESRLAYAETLARSALGAAHIATDAEVNVISQLSGALALLDSASEYDPKLEQIADRLRAVRIEVDDIASELHSYGSSVDVDPQRLSHVQERRAELGTLQRKYGPSLDAVIDWAENALVEIAALDVDETGLASLEAAIEVQRSQINELAATITSHRVKAADKLSKAVEAELADLALEKARVRIDITPTELGPHGADKVRFTFAANSGAQLQVIGQGASGGELSRLMLAIEVVLADKNPVPTLVFDEVDAGIGGRTAIEVGRKLARLARNAQIIVVTHLPQVAAFADQHYVVQKSDNGDVTHSSVSVVEESKRVEELARMISGRDDSDTALAHARELLELSQSD